MVSISKRTSRTKPYLVSYRDNEGRQHTRSFPLLKEAKTFAAKVEIKKPAGSNAAVPLQQAVDAFLEDRRAHSPRPRFVPTRPRWGSSSNQWT